ncbi:ABC transporter permease [Bacillus sp. V33-4]|uniref:ABC transporter permease n=1 Tax=Bacillus sp. V33-4 TaxID=2054169 RepID=UPI000C767BBC|nr:ABC transporter permease [Bacillus sp. V33-4]PLR85146.1 ABC transporter permease [Bacillus sp. V33-4]
MRKMWAICRMEIQRLLKKRQSYLLMFAMPLLFTFIFGSLFGTDVEEKMIVLFVDQDRSVLSQSLFDQIEENNTLFEIRKSSSKKAKQMLESKEMGGAIIVSKGFQERMLAKQAPNVTFQHIPEFSSTSTITQILSNKLVKMKLEVLASNKWSEHSGEAWQVMFERLKNAPQTKPLAIDKINIDEKATAPQMSGISASASGFSIMFVMIVMMSVTGTILEARKNGVWYRMLSTPASRLEISTGYLLSFFLIGWIQFGALMIFTHFLFGVQWGDPFAVILLVSAMLFAIVGLGLLIAGMVNTVEQQSSIGNIVVVATCMVSGVYWPLEIEPVFMQKIAEFLPQTWAIRGFTDLVATGGTLLDVLDNVAILLVFSLLFLFIAMRRIKFE